MIGFILGRLSIGVGEVKAVPISIESFPRLSRKRRFIAARMAVISSAQPSPADLPSKINQVPATTRFELIENLLLASLEISSKVKCYEITD
jgi:hypothetical protein